MFFKLIRWLKQKWGHHFKRSKPGGDPNPDWCAEQVFLWFSMLASSLFHFLSPSWEATSYFDLQSFWQHLVRFIALRRSFTGGLRSLNSVSWCEYCGLG